MRSWAKFAPASEHVFKLELRHRGDVIKAWLDGRFVHRIPTESAGSSITFGASESAFILSVRTLPEPETSRFLPLDIGMNRHQEETTLSGLELDTPLGNMKTLLKVAPIDRAIDVGLARWLRQSHDSANFYDPYYKRSTWDNLSETIIFRAPVRHYHTAHVLCAVDPGESPTMGVR